MEKAGLGPTCVPVALQWPLVRSSYLLGDGSYLRAWRFREDVSHHLAENHSLPLN